MTAVDAVRAELVGLLEPVLAHLHELHPETCTSDQEVRALERALDERFPLAGAQVQAIGRAIADGVAAGALCDRGEPGARFSRVAKPGPATHGFSVDLVRLSGAGLRHGHPQGEVTLGFAVDGDDPRFEGRAAGWVFLRPKTVHVPEVVGGTMDLIYFLPAGTVDWSPA